MLKALHSDSIHRNIQYNQALRRKFSKTEEVFYLPAVHTILVSLNIHQPRHLPLANKWMLLSTSEQIQELDSNWCTTITQVCFQIV